MRVQYMIANLFILILATALLTIIIIQSKIFEKFSAKHTILGIISNRTILADNYQSGKVSSSFDESLTENITRHSAQPCHSPAFLLAIIHSAIDNFDYRQAIRQSWGSSKLFNTPDRPNLWRALFIVGKTQNKSINAKIEKESLLYGDLILGEFIDSYLNLTYKTLLGMKWAYAYCKPRFILKVDDDVFVNIYLLYNELLKLKNTLDFYSGYGHIHIHPHRQKSHKWYVSYQDYKHEYFPDYCIGGGYVLSGNMLGKILSVEHSVRKVRLEDAYTGILVHRVHGKLIHDGRFYGFHSFYRFWILPRPCDYKAIILQHGVPQPQYHMILMSIAKKGYHLNDCQCLHIAHICYKSGSWLLISLYIITATITMIMFNICVKKLNPISYMRRYKMLALL